MSDRESPLQDRQLFDANRLDRLRRQVMSTTEAQDAAYDIEWLMSLNEALAARHSVLAEALRDVMRYPVGDAGYVDIAREALGGER